ncbi:MAG: phosphoribosylglycinamide synthetase C domain-containing protein, partial [Bacteroidota bacterium]
GMGSISPVPFATPELMSKIDAEVIQPSVRGLQAESMDFVGFLFIGLMIVEDVPYVLEYNVRMGDPETQSVFPRIASDVVDLFVAAAKGELDQYNLQIRPETAATVIAVSGGYPEAYQKGKIITGLDQISVETLISHAGTAQKEGETVTSGGRVLAFTTLDESAKDALAKSQKAAETVQFEGKYFRRDIGFDLELN